MICGKCNSTEVVQADRGTVKCNNCGYALSVKSDDSESVFFKSGEPHFDSKKYTCNPRWMEQVTGSPIAKKKSLWGRLKQFFKHLFKK